MLDKHPEVTELEEEWSPGWCLCGAPWGEDERCIWGSACPEQREADKFREVRAAERAATGRL